MNSDRRHGLAHQWETSDFSLGLVRRLCHSLRAFRAYPHALLARNGLHGAAGPPRYRPNSG